MPLIIHLVQVLLVICEKSVKCKTLTIDYSMLCQKQIYSICIYPSGIDTNPITHPIDAHWRQTSIPAISHTPRYIPNAMLSHMRIYFTKTKRNINKNTRIS